MNDMKLLFYRQRVVLLVVLLAISLCISGIYSWVRSENNIQKTNFTVSLDEDTEEIFGHYFEDTKKFYKYYNYTTSSENYDFIFTSDIEKIDITRDYIVEGYSPLVVCLNNSKNLNNYLKTTTKEGFLTCSSNKKIQNDSSDEITCDFLRIIEAVLNREDWSDLGGEDKKITIYCPESDTVAGNLFYEFLLITINNGKYPTDNIEQIKEKADMFLDSPNTIQTDVISKISKLGGILQEEDIYVLFESDLIFEAKSSDDMISVAYPETTVVKQLYLQYNNSELEGTVVKPFEDFAYHLRYSYYYRNDSYPDFINSQYNYPYYFNLQKGFNYYELTE